MVPKRPEALLPDETAPISFIRELSGNVAQPESTFTVPPLRSPRLDGLELATAPRRAADTIIEVLVDAGVDTFFGIPGGPVSPILTRS